METGSSPVQMEWRMLMVRISLAINRTFVTLIKKIKKYYIFFKTNKIIKKRIKKIRGGRPPQLGLGVVRPPLRTK
jgi:hypothetical protein